MVHTLRILRWVYLGRLTLAAGIFGGAVLVWLRDTVPQATLLATLALLASLVMTLASAWWTHVLGRHPGKNFLYAQVLFDTLLVTVVVHITGGAESSFPPLYILVIAAGSLLLPLPGGMLIGALASLLYFADMIWWQDVEPSQTAVLQIVLFVLVAMMTAALGDRLRRAGRALGEVESELRQLRLDTNDILAAIDTGLVTVDDGLRMVHMNGAAELQLGMQASAWQGRDVLGELNRSAPGLGDLIGETMRTQLPVRRHEIRVPAADSERVLTVRTTLLERAGKPWATAVLQDITEVRQIDDLIRRAERLQAVAELGASLAHEIRNPLASIRSAVEQLAGERLLPADHATLQRLVLDESDRLSRLLTEFMEFSRVELRRWTVVDIGGITSAAIGLVAQHPDSVGGARIEFLPPVAPVEVEGDHDLLHRAVFNLVLNAVQHAGPHGVVQVAVGRVNELDLPPSVQLEAPVRLTVHDSGPGIRQEDIARVFDPFYTTRDGGTGLGLAMVHRAVEAHRGAILVDGVPGDGARFTVYLPAPSARRF